MSQDSSVQKLSTTAEVDSASVQPFPNSQKVFVEGSRADIQVPMREITLTPTAVAGSDPKTLRLKIMLLYVSMILQALTLTPRLISMCVKVYPVCVIRGY